MSRNINTDIIAQLESNELTPVSLVKFNDGANIYCYCDLDVPLYLDTTMSGVTISGTFEPLGFRFDSIRYSLGSIVDQAVVTIDNVDQAMTSVFVDGTIQGETASIYIAVLDIDNSVIAVATIFTGDIDSWELDEKEVRITIASLFTRWNNKTTSLHSASCRWKEFKGAECQYTGSGSWCDRTYTRCQALGNTQHFGGFRFLPDFENRQLAWGPNVETSTTITRS